MKKILISLLLFPCTLWSQSDSIDPVLINSNWNQTDYIDLGNNGTARYGIFQVDTNIHYPLVFGDSMITTPITDLMYSFGTVLDQLFKIRHQQPIGRAVSGVVSFDKINSTGMYQRQATNLNDIRADLVGIWDRYRTDLSFRTNSGTIEQNGGIAFDTLFTDNVFSERASIPVNLSTAAITMEDLQLHWRNGFSFFADTLARFHGFVSLGLRSGTWRYDDADPMGGFYDSVYVDTVNTADRRTWDHWLGSVGFVWEDSIRSGQISFDMDLNDRAAIGFDTSFTDLSVSFRGKEVLFDQFWMRFDGMVGFSGYISNQFEANFAIGDEFKGMVMEVFGRYGNTAPDLWMNRYRSNHFIWANDFTQPEDLAAGVMIKPTRWNTTFKFGMASVMNMVYLDSTFRPVQYDETVDRVFGEVSTNFTLGKFRLDARTIVQSVSNDTVLRVPQVNAAASLYFADRIFKNSMLVNIGFNVRYFSEFKAPTYVPALEDFAMTGDVAVGGYPYIDFFIDARVREAGFYLKLAHVNSGLMGYDYFLLDKYPARDLAFYFGISWKFVN